MSIAGKIALVTGAGVAQLVCYIASDESGFMTGSSIRLDGGSMLL